MSSYIDRYIKLFPGEDLRFINNLWLKYSQGHFGFSVQKNIWKKGLSRTCGGKRPISDSFLKKVVPNSLQAKARANS